MTTGEMNLWTKRFNQILGAAQGLKQERLNNMRNDLAAAYEGKRFDPFAGYMFAALTEEMEG